MFTVKRTRLPNQHFSSITSPLHRYAYYTHTPLLHRTTRLSSCNTLKNQRWWVCSFTLRSAFYSTTRWIHRVIQMGWRNISSPDFTEEIFSARTQVSYFTSCPLLLQLCLLPALTYQFQWHLLCGGLSILQRTSLFTENLNYTGKKLWRS